MKKEINLYFPIYSYTADYFIQKMNEYDGEDISLRVNSPGGDVFAGWGIASKMKEVDSKVIAKVDGIAASMAAFLLLFADEVHMSDSGRVMLHRADMQIRNDDDQKFLDNVNEDLKKALKARISNQSFKDQTGMTIEKMFDPNNRVDVWLNAKQAKAIGIVDKIIKLKPSKVSALYDYSLDVAAYGLTPPPKNVINEKAATNADISTTKNINMTAEEFAKENPEAYNAMIKGAKAKENDRVNSWLKFVEVDAEAVKKGIESGENISQTAYADFIAKMASNTAAAALNLQREGEETSGLTSQDESESTEHALTDKEKAIAELEAEIKKYLPKSEKAEK